MLPKNLLRSTFKFFKSLFNRQAGYLNILHVPCCNSCCSTVQRRFKGSSSFRDSEELCSNLTSHFEATATNDNVNAKCATDPEDANSSSRKRNNGAKKKVKIQTSDPNVRKPERKSSEIGRVGDEGDNGGKKEKAVDCLVVKKLKEMKSVDERNSEHVMDIEEVVYYYSLITSQTYVEIVDKFFVDLSIESSDCRILLGSGSLGLGNV